MIYKGCEIFVQAIGDAHTQVRIKGPWGGGWFRSEKILTRTFVRTQVDPDRRVWYTCETNSDGYEELEECSRGTSGMLDNVLKSWAFNKEVRERRF